jgi:hypothetical protein
MMATPVSLSARSSAKMASESSSKGKGELIPQADVLATGTQVGRHFREIPETFFHVMGFLRLTDCIADAFERQRMVHHARDENEPRPVPKARINSPKGTTI